MELTEEHVRQFHTEGWTAVPNFWTAPEIAAMRAELDRLKTEGKLRNVATDGDGVTHSKTRVNLQLCPMWPHSPLFQAMPFAPKVQAAIEQLIGAPALLHLDQVFLKPGGKRGRNELASGQCLLPDSRPTERHGALDRRA